MKSVAQHFPRISKTGSVGAPPETAHAPAAIPPFLILHVADRPDSTAQFEAFAKALINHLLEFMLAIGPRTKNLLLGTATPIQTDVQELWNLLRILNAGADFVLGRKCPGDEEENAKAIVAMLSTFGGCDREASHLRTIIDELSHPEARDPKLAAVRYLLGETNNRKIPKEDRKRPKGGGSRWVTLPPIAAPRNPIWPGGCKPAPWP